MKTASLTKKIILHIGMHKTGTTAIQKAFDGQAADGVGYAELSHTNHSVPLMTIFQDAPYYYWERVGVTGQDITSRKRKFTAMLDAQLERSDIDTLVLSGEDIGWLTEPEKLAMVDFFEQRGHSLRVICLTRHPSEFAKSALQQRIQGGLRDVTEIHPRYVDRLQFFLGRLGRDCVTIADYTSLCQNFGDVVAGFNALADLPFVAPTLVRRNTALSAEATRIIFRLNQLTQELSPQYFQLLEQVVPIVSQCFPVTDVDSESLWRPAEQLLPASLSEELDFLEHEFGIRYAMKQPEPSTQSVEEFLRIPDGFSLDSIQNHLSHSLNANFSRCTTLDGVLLRVLDLFSVDASGSGQ